MTLAPRVALVLTALLAAGSGALRAQAREKTSEPSAVVRGRVMRADGPVGVGDAQVVLRPPGTTVRTAPDGAFEFRGVAPGRLEIEARRPGFVPAAVTLSLAAGAQLEVSITLEAVAAVLDPIVVSPTREPRSLGQVAGAVSVMDSAAVHRDRTVGLHEVLRNVPGVQASSRYGTQDVSIGIRGSAARPRATVRGVAVLLDGIPLTEPDGAARLDLIELAAARRIEVVRGPASALHAGSPAGVVNVVSLTGRDAPGVVLRSQLGAYGFRKYDARVGGLFAHERGSGMLAASFTTADGYRAHSESDIARAHLVIDYLASGDARISLQATASHLDSRLPGSLTLAEMDASPAAAAPVATAFRFGRGDTRYRTGARVEREIGSGSAAAYFFFGGRTLHFPIPSEIVDLDLGRVQGGGRVRVPGPARLPIDVTVGLDYDRLFGMDHRWENLAGAQGPLHDAGYFAVRAFGIYAQAEWWTAGSVSSTLGFRYDAINYRFEGEVAGGVPRQERTFAQASPRLATVWRPDAATSLYASIGRGMEVPVIGELSLSPGDSLRSVRAKSLWNYEVGGRRVLGDRVRVDASLFLAAVRGELVPVTIDGRNVPENASRSRSLGLELGVTALATPWLEVGASYTWLDLRLLEYRTFLLRPAGTLEEVDFSGKRMPAVPEHRLSSEALLRPARGLSLGVEMEWQGTVYVETGNAREGTWLFAPGPGDPVQQVPFQAVPARTLVHVSASVEWGRATLFGRVENLFGVRHAGYVVANDWAGRFYETGPPTWVSVGLRMTWEGGGGAVAGL